MSKAVLGNRNEKIIVFYSYKDEREFKRFRQAMDELINPKVLQSTVFVVFVENEADKQVLPEIARFKYFSKKDLNFIRQYKDKQLGELMKDKYDSLLVFGQIDEYHLKRINRVQATKRIITNSNENLKFDISIKANAIGIEQIVNFAKETLEKIQQ